MTSVDPSTGQPLPADAIQRILHITAKVHVFQVPPLTSNKGYQASTWTVNPPIFSARLRVMETAVPSAGNEKVSVAILLEDPGSGELFAAAPYNHPSSVSPTTDSSRFFALRVVGDGGRKATLGVGFEERSDAFDFNIALQDASKTLGFGNTQQGPPGAAQKGGASAGKAAEADKARDYSLKEGETITVSIAGRGAGGRSGSAAATAATSMGSDAAASGPVPFLPPPPSAAEVKAGLNESSPSYNTTTTAAVTKPAPSAKELGFDDGEFGEFQ